MSYLCIHISSPAETAWASLEHSSQEANQHILSIQIVAWRESPALPEIPIWRVPGAVKHFAVEELHQAPISNQPTVSNQPIILMRQMIGCGVLDYPGNQYLKHAQRHSPDTQLYHTIIATEQTRFS